VSARVCKARAAAVDGAERALWASIVQHWTGMDSRSLDHMTRAVSAASSRRAVVRAALALIFATAFTRGRSASAQTTCAEACLDDQVCVDGACVRPCENHRDCRSKHDDPCILNQCLDGVCVEAIVDCLPGYECCEGSCCPTGCEFDVDCAVLDPCRWGRCGESGQCEFTVIDPCLLCASDLDCAAEPLNTACCGGACQRPCPEGTVMGKGCECRADGSASLNGPVVRDDASG
jgi:hypothetical protein